MGSQQDKTIRCPKCLSILAEESRFCSHCGFPLEDDQGTLTFTPSQEVLRDARLHFAPGDSFGPRYKIIEEIGRGGMGRVYKAQDNELAIAVALKMIRPEYSANPRFIEQFRHETLLARSVSHPNVIRIHDIGEVNDIKFISMDYIKGHSLKELIHTSGSLTIEGTLNITRQICEGLKIAHQRRIVHQDLNPRNIMIDNDGQVFIMDFGVAKSIEAQVETEKKEIIGTLPYISPEQAVGNPADQRSDIYSLGIMIFEMLTGCRPFESDSAEEYVRKHTTEKPPWPSKFNPLIPPFLDRLILRCLEKDPDHRYQDVEEILKDLEEHKEESRIYPIPPPAKKRLKAAALIPLLLVAALLVYLLVPKIKSLFAPAPPIGKLSLAVLYFENITGDDSLAFWGKALSSLIVHDLSQSKFVRVLTEDRLREILQSLDLIEARTYAFNDLKKVGEKGSVRYIISGNFTRAEDIFRIHANLHDIATGAVIASTREEGRGDSTFYRFVDNLTPWVKSELKLNRQEIALDFDSDVGDIITRNPEALMHFILGRQYYNEGRFLLSNESFEEAVKIDPEFALAYRCMSENYHYIGDFDQSKRFAQKAVDLAENASLRDRYLIRGWAFTILEDTYDKAIANYKEMLRYYPDDEEGNTSIGAIYRNMEEWDLAEGHFLKIVDLNPIITCGNLSLLYTAKGEYDKAGKLLTANKENYTNPSFFHWEMSLLYLAQGKVELALGAIQEALSLDPNLDQNLELMGNVYQCRDDFQKAALAYDQLQEGETLNTKMRGMYWTAHLSLAQGQYRKAASEFMEVVRVAEENELEADLPDLLEKLAYLKMQMGDFDQALAILDRARVVASKIRFVTDIMLAHCFSGIINVRQGNFVEAKNRAAELRKVIEERKIPKHQRYYYHLMGLIAAGEGLRTEAAEYFEKALALLSRQYEVFDMHAFFLYPYAVMSFERGELEGAQQRFERIVNLTTGRLQWGDLYALSHYWLGKIYQQKGWEGKALESYENFLSLWEKADEGCVEVEDARKELPKLKGKS